MNELLCYHEVEYIIGRKGENFTPYSDLPNFLVDGVAAKTELQYRADTGVPNEQTFLVAPDNTEDLWCLWTLRSS